ncbi:MAG TPA: EamA family transporter [Trebonia sp.]|nr:EamA family transporter [Trebonia sp.]
MTAISSHDAAHSPAAARAALPVTLVLTGAVSVQCGAGLASQLFTQVPPAAVTALRLWAATLILALVAGPGTARTVRDLIARRAWGDAATMAAFGTGLGLMNFAIYQAFARIPLGIAVTIEFLGPLAVAVAGSRRARPPGQRGGVAPGYLGLAWALLAACGVLLLARAAGSHLNLAGVGWALASAAGWAAYILFNKATGERAAGASGLMVAMAVAAALVSVPGVLAGGRAMFRPRFLAEGAGIGLLSSVIPYWLELEALRRVPARVFGVWMSLQPAVAALIGLIMLRQRLDLAEWAGICCVVLASAGAARGGST